MAEQQQDPEGHPVVAGLLALLGVGLAIGLLISGAALAGTSVLGLGDGESDSGSASSAQSVYVPDPEPTEEETGALITLAPKPSPTGGGSEESEAPEPEDAISLSAAVTAVKPGEPIDLSGVYPGHEGAKLVVQRYEGDTWVDFANGDVVATVKGEIFSTYVITSRTGLTPWRVRDTATDEVSNEVRVQIG